MAKGGHKRPASQRSLFPYFGAMLGTANAKKDDIGSIETHISLANFPRRRHLCQDRQAVNMFRKKRQLTGAPAQVRPAPKIVKRQAFTPHKRYQFLDSGQTVSNSMANIAGRGANHGAIIPNRGLGTCTRPSLRHISDTFSQTPKPAKQVMAGRQRFRNCPGPSDDLREATRPRPRGQHLSRSRESQSPGSATFHCRQTSRDCLTSNPRPKRRARLQEPRSN